MNKNAKVRPEIDIICFCSLNNPFGTFFIGDVVTMEEVLTVLIKFLNQRIVVVFISCHHYPKIKRVITTWEEQFLRLE